MTAALFDSEPMTIRERIDQMFMQYMLGAWSFGYLIMSWLTSS